MISVLVKIKHSKKEKKDIGGPGKAFWEGSEACRNQGEPYGHLGGRKEHLRQKKQWRQGACGGGAVGVFRKSKKAMCLKQWSGSDR